MSTRSFDVLLEHTLVGHLMEAETGGWSFRFTESYRRQTRRPVLGQKFEDDLHRTYGGKRGELPAFFANLVPEGGLRKIIEESAGIPEGDDVSLLSVIGADLPGAVVLRPSSTSFPDDKVGAHANGQEPDDQEESSEARLHFSLAGMQLKFSVLREDDKLTLPVHGMGGQWIAKLASPSYPGLPENEYTALEWARAAGFVVPECHLHRAEDLRGIPRRHIVPGTHVLAIRRYDREGARRIHQEDFAQVVGLSPSRKFDHLTYEGVAKLARSIVGEDGYEEVVRRLVLIVACGNNDAHLKNWSLVYPDGVSAAIAPLYDQVCTVAWSGHDREPESRLDRKLALKLGGVKHFGDVNERVFRILAARVGADLERTIRLARDTVDRLAKAWAIVVVDAPMRPEHVEAVRAHWLRVPFLRERAVAI